MPWCWLKTVSVAYKLHTIETLQKPDFTDKNAFCKKLHTFAHLILFDT